MGARQPRLALTPTVGRYQRANLEIDLVGDQKYYRAVYEHQWYKPLFRRSRWP
jgi:outer membrane protein insertion porin family